MPADPDDLARRLAAATPADTLRGLNFNAVFAVVRDALGPDTARAIDPAGKGARIDFVSYPAEEYLRIAFAAVERLEPRFGGAEAAWHEIGARSVGRFFDSTLGRTVLAIAGRDPLRFVSAAPGWYRAGVSYGERSVRYAGERRLVAEFRRDFIPPPFHRAVILTGLEAAGARGVSVDATPVGLLDTDFAVSWEAP